MPVAQRNANVLPAGGPCHEERTRGAAGPSSGRVHHLADAPQGLADALLVLDQGEAHEAVAGRAEADARTDRDLGLGEQQLAELERPQVRGTGSGIGAQTNIVPRGLCTGQPMRASPSQSTSRRRSVDGRPPAAAPRRTRSGR